MKRFFLIAVLLCVAAASLLSAGYAYYAAEDAARIKFEGTAEEALNRIRSRTQLHLSLLRATAALFRAGSGDIDRNALQAFVGALDLEGDYAGISGLGYARLIRRGDEASAEASMRGSYALDRAIWPPQGEAYRAPVLMLEPLSERNKAALGFDMFSDPVRRAAMQAAMESGRAWASGRVQLVQGIGDPSYAGFLIYIPLAPGVPNDALPAARAEGTTGFVYAPFRSDELFNAALGQSPLLPLSVEIYDGKPDSSRLLYRSQSAPDPAGDMWTRRELTVAGRTWVLRMRPTSAFVYPTSRLTALGLGLLGLILAAMMALLVRASEKSYEAANALREASERSLQEKDLMLQEMKHRIKNSIARVLAISRQTIANSSSLEEFSGSFGARLQSMASSQDMLTRSRWQKADLEELLKTELDQVFGQDMSEPYIGGPRVEIDEATTQSLGLTFHELATNALKYGSVGAKKDFLSVSWKLSGERGNRRLDLNWRERGSAKPGEPARVGFGTKLIEANIVRELGGTISRRFDDDGLEIEISIPLSQ